MREAHFMASRPMQSTCFMACSPSHKCVGIRRDAIQAVRDPTSAPCACGPSCPRAPNTTTDRCSRNTICKLPWTALVLPGLLSDAVSLEKARLAFNELVEKALHLIQSQCDTILTSVASAVTLSLLVAFAVSMVSPEDVLSIVFSAIRCLSIRMVLML